MQGNQTILDPPDTPGQDKGRATERKSHVFTFDKSYWSAGPRDDPQYCSQETLYKDLGVELLEHGFSGFNACIVACMLSNPHRVAWFTYLLLIDGQTGMVITIFGQFGRVC